MQRRQLLLGTATIACVNFLPHSNANAAFLLPWGLLKSAATLVTLWDGASMAWSAYQRYYGGSEADEAMRKPLRQQGFEPKQGFSVPQNGKQQPALLGQKPDKKIANCLVVTTPNGPVMFEGGSLMTIHDAWRELEKSGATKDKISALTKPTKMVNNTNAGDICTGYGRPMIYGTERGRVLTNWKVETYAGKKWTGGQYIIEDRKTGTRISGDSNAYIIENC